MTLKENEEWAEAAKNGAFGNVQSKPNPMTELFQKRAKELYKRHKANSNNNGLSWFITKALRGMF